MRHKRGTFVLGCHVQPVSISFINYEKFLFFFFLASVASLIRWTVCNRDLLRKQLSLSPMLASSLLLIVGGKVNAFIILQNWTVYTMIRQAKAQVQRVVKYVSVIPFLLWSHHYCSGIHVRSMRMIYKKLNGTHQPFAHSEGQRNTLYKKKASLISSPRCSLGYLTEHASKPTGTADWGSTRSKPVL